jgi:hypothetical protein
VGTAVIDERTLLLASLWGDAVNGANLLREANDAHKAGDQYAVNFKMREAGLRLEECLLKVRELLR